ncbi:TetR/AcrR family transcriptional regulator [Liquorilactobacillus uvarum]|uniref:TetR/AcrR family transcriptional regulator n=2 Tax=Liquorilactobacillus uvarum TaxID=303240 RepID=UPI00288BF04D|nr:TetR/AcrR family transcriptional regulator [Liquorilactobacillus uvarum]
MFYKLTNGQKKRRNMRSAMTDEQRREKCQAILGAALKLFRKKTFSDIRMADIAQQVNISKGTLFNYYNTKENIFMDLLLTGYQIYFEELDQKITKISHLSINEFKFLLLEESKLLIKQHRVILRLNALRESVLEARADMSQTIEGRLKLNEIVLHLGKTIAERVDEVEPKEAGHLLIMQSAILSGVLNMSNLDKFDQHKIGKRLETFRLDFESEAIQAFELYLNGLFFKSEGKRNNEINKY